MLFSQHLNWNLLVFLQELSQFDFKHNSYKQIIKNKIIKTFKILKESTNSAKDAVSINFLSSYTFQFSAYMLSSDCQEYSCSS